ncbi:MAG TPA: GMC family oxidoreductase [Actinomycetota bacterium]|nr:GMC family oxidoreductase [Actinomycetota bacterium]
MSAFTARQKATLEALARVLLPEGHGLPGGDSAGAAAALDARAETWDGRVLRGVKLLLDAWELSPLASRHRARFSMLGEADRVAWTMHCYRSKAAWRRLQVTALKQLLFLEWACSPVVEDALGYDYRCRKEGVPHGAARALVGDPDPGITEPEPADYHRTGPAVASGAIPIALMSKRDFEGPQSRDLTTQAWPDLFDGQRENVDVVVVGSGAGGAVAATYLAEAGLNVLVLEEGQQVTADDFAGPMFDRLQRFCRGNGTTQVWGSPPIPLPLGKVVGGTTVVNSGTCFRGPQRVLERWASEFGVEGARLDEMIEHYEPLEEFLNVRPVPWDLLGPNGMAAHRGAVALGYSGGPLLRNITDCHGCGQCAFGCPTNAKQAMHVSFLPRAQMAGARIFSRCRVDTIVTERDGAAGVEATLLGPDGRSRGRLRVSATHVVVAAGAVYTPSLLKKSGVPDPSGQTGRNLRIHPATGVGGAFDEDVKNWKGTLQSYYIDEFFDSHELMFEATTTVPSIGAGALPGIGEQAMQELGRFRNLASLGFYVSDTSRGRVLTLRGGEAFPVYRMNALDARRMQIGLSIACEVMLEAGAKKVYPGIPGIDAIDARADLEQLRERRVRPEHLKLTAFHPMGTARMGGDPSSSVVDPYGHHHAVERLWVVDSSTFPSCVAVNPQMTIMAFAKRTAEYLARKF